MGKLKQPKLVHTSMRWFKMQHWRKINDHRDAAILYLSTRCLPWVCLTCHMTYTPLPYFLISPYTSQFVHLSSILCLPYLHFWPIAVWLWFAFLTHLASSACRPVAHCKLALNYFLPALPSGSVYWYMLYCWLWSEDCLISARLIWQCSSVKSLQVSGWFYWHALISECRKSTWTWKKG